MTALFVHGVPDTERVWHAVLPRLGGVPAATVRLPGFGAPTPPGFDPTKDGYAAWLVEQIAARGEPVDLVGHDWGALLVLRAACLRPDLVRSWAAGAAPLDAEYVWHRAAQAWQTPEVGEQVMAQLTAPALEKALATAAVPPDDAREAARALDDTMKRCILRLYRSAVHVGAEWGPDLARLEAWRGIEGCHGSAGAHRAIGGLGAMSGPPVQQPAPGLVLWGEQDPYAAPVWGERLAKRTGAGLVVFPGCSHWWPLQRPAEVAAELARHWQGRAR
jgi:pimeloyl-ACP methyl ester carboxylesterase